MSCNIKDERERLSRLASREDYRPAVADTVQGHKWMHSMILYQVVPEVEEPLSVEDQLSTMEENIRNLEDSIRSREDEFSERLQRLEGMLTQLVSMLTEKCAG